MALDKAETPKRALSQVDHEFVAALEVLDRDPRPMPGSWVQVTAVDSRLTQAKAMVMGGQSVGPKAVREVNTCEHMATMRHKPTGILYVCFRETIDALYLRQQDPVKFPEWLMKHAVKRTELKIFVARVLRKPDGRHDRGWIQFFEDENSDIIFESIVWFLLRKKVLTEEMYGRE